MSTTDPITPDATTPGVYAIRVRKPGFVDRLIAEGHESPLGRADMSRNCDPPGEWGRAPRTFGRREVAELHAKIWAENYPGYSFEVVERVLVPAWRAAGEGE